MESQRILDVISDQTLYRDQLDAAKFAVALALAKEVAPTTGIDLSTKWNVGSFDPTGDLRTVILAYWPDCEEPYRFAEGLLEAGLVLLREHMDIHGQVDIEVLLNELKSNVAELVADVPKSLAEGAE